MGEGDAGVGARRRRSPTTLGATVTHRIVIRARADITTRHRFRDGARIYRIVALRDQDGSGRFLEIGAQERVGSRPLILRLPAKRASRMVLMRALTHLRHQCLSGDDAPCPPLPAAALRAAIHDALIADAPLTALLGGARVYDEPPREPGVSLCHARRGAHRGFLHRHRARRGASAHAARLVAPGRSQEAHLIAGALLQALDDAPLTLADHRLVNFRFALADVRREADGRTYHALVRFAP